MKRPVAFIICGVFAIYGLVALYSVNFLGMARLPYVKMVLKPLKKFCGMGVLFVKDASMVSHATSYRFFQDGQWQPWQLLEEPLFEDYKARMRVASLKHNRLDKHLSQKISMQVYKTGIGEMKQGKDFELFMAHLFFSHNGNKRPDSLEVMIEREFNHLGNAKRTIKFKHQP